MYAERRIDKECWKIINREVGFKGKYALMRGIKVDGDTLFGQDATNRVSTYLSTLWK